MDDAVFVDVDDGASVDGRAAGAGAGGLKRAAAAAPEAATQEYSF